MAKLETILRELQDNPPDTPFSPGGPHEKIVDSLVKVGKTAVPSLLTFIKSKNSPSSKYICLSALEQLDDELMDEASLYILENRDENDFIFDSELLGLAAIACAKSGNEHAIEPLRKLLRQSLCMTEIVKSLAKLHAVEALDDIKNAFDEHRRSLGDPHENVNFLGAHQKTTKVFEETISFLEQIREVRSARDCWNDVKVHKKSFIEGISVKYSEQRKKQKKQNLIITIIALAFVGIVWFAPFPGFGICLNCFLTAAGLSLRTCK